MYVRTLLGTLRPIFISSRVVTDNAASFVAAGRIIMASYPTIYWTPCVAHCLDLLLEDIGKINWISMVVRRAKIICKFIYMNSHVCHLFLEVSKGVEIVRPAPTRFATNFILLESIQSHKSNLMNMFVSEKYHNDERFARARRLPMGKVAKKAIWDETQFWHGVRNCILDPSTSITRTMSCIPKFIPVDGKGSSVQGMSKGCQFRLVSFNILAQVYVKSVFFPHSPSYCLRWKNRSQAVLKLLKGLQADFLCLQELDEYETFYKEEMKKEGYLPVYVQRRGRKRDGCGIFYQNKRAELLFEEPIDYNDLVPHDSQDTNEAKDDEAPDYCVRNDENTVAASDSSKGATAEERGDPNDPKVRLKRDCVGLLTAFKLLESSNSVIVIANTHIYWDPEWIDVKLAQVKYLISRLARFVEKVSEELKCSPLVIVAGDFNSTPGDEVYQYLTTNSNETNSLTASDAKPLAFHSLYSFLGGEPAFTNCTPDFTGTLDYILFANPDRIQPITYLQLPSADSSEVHGGLPNANYPSDHLPIGADFEIL